MLAAGAPLAYTGRIDPVPPFCRSLKGAVLLATPDPPAVSLRAVSKSFGARRVVDDVTLEVAKGEFLAVLGPSGSGKTTIMRLIGGFEAPDQGRILIEGTDVTDRPAERRRVNTVFQSYALFPHLSVLDNVAYGPRMQGLGRAAILKKAHAMLELVRLDEAAPLMPHQLSGGMQQRVALARALAADPAVLLLDEPLGALDRKLRDEMQRELRRVQGELGATFLYVTHDQEEAFGMADRLAVMRDGRFAQIGAPDAVYDAPRDSWVARFVGSANVIPARVEGLTPAIRLVGAGGLLAASFGEPGLGVGDAALVVVRPEATRIGSPAAGTGPNRIAARLADAVAIGPSLRLQAVTPDGLAFESLVSRATHGAEPVLRPGSPVLVTFEPKSARAYRDERVSAHHERTSP